MARSKKTIILGTLVAVFFALNFLTFANQWVKKKHDHHHPHHGPDHQEMVEVHQVRFGRSVAPVVETHVILRNEMEHAAREVERVQRDMERVHEEMERAQLEMARIDLDKLRRGLEDTRDFICSEELEQARRELDALRKRLKIQSAALDQAHQHPMLPQVYVTPPVVH